MAISPGRTRQALVRAQAALGIGTAERRDRWPPDATRHTFAIYAFALGRDAGQVASWLGHEGAPGTFYRHYRGLATRAEAERISHCGRKNVNSNASVKIAKLERKSCVRIVGK
jgi:integrase